MSQTVQIDGKDVEVYTKGELDTAAAAARREGRAQADGDISRLTLEMKSAQDKIADVEVVSKKAVTERDAIQAKLDATQKELTDKLTAAEQAAKKAAGGNAIFRQLSRSGLPIDMAEFLVDHPTFSALDLSTEDGKAKFDAELKSLKERSPSLFDQDDTNTSSTGYKKADMGSGRSPQTGADSLPASKIAQMDTATYRANRDKILTEN
jgi:hypothetical protein